MERQVGDAEHGGQAGYAERPVLNPALDEDLESLLELDDRRRVPVRGLEVELTEAADQLVDAVQGKKRSDLHRAAVRRGERVPERESRALCRVEVALHGAKLRSPLSPVSTAIPTIAVRRARAVG